MLATPLVGGWGSNRTRASVDKVVLDSSLSIFERAKVLAARKQRLCSGGARRRERTRRLPTVMVTGSV